MQGVVPRVGGDALADALHAHLARRRRAFSLSKIVSVEEAAAMIQDRDVLAFNAMGWLGNPEIFHKALERRFLEEGHPRDLTLYCTCGIGGREAPELANRLAHKGLVSRLIIGHYDTLRGFFPMINGDEIEAYNLPQGFLAHNLHEAARHSPGFFTRIGLHTSVDPRLEGPGLNSISCEEFVKVVEVEGEEHLFVKTIYPTACVIRATTADVNGNITFEKEALQLDALTLAQAVKNNGGRVVVQVERISDSHSNPQLVRIPCQFVDAIYRNPDQMQTGTESYNALYSGEYHAPWVQVSDYMAQLVRKGTEMSVKRLDADRVIARRACMEIRPRDVINLGIGIPTSIGLELDDMKLLSPHEITFSVELGMIGGIPAGEIAFGAVINADANYDQNSMFEYYEGGGLDIAFVGALEFDRRGNVNILRVGEKLFGLGGFNFVTQTPKRLAVCTKFMLGSGCGKRDGKWALIDGRQVKLVDRVEHVSFNGEQAVLNGQKVTYITERAVFELGENGLCLTEIAPFADVERDVLAHLGFSVEVSKDLREMPPACFDLFS
jgi:propionate CoA-transferase